MAEPSTGLRDDEDPTGDYIIFALSVLVGLGIVALAIGLIAGGTSGFS